MAAVPAKVTVPAGDVEVPVPVTAGFRGTARITARLYGSHVHSTVIVTATRPTLTSLLPATLQLGLGAAGWLTVTISAAQKSHTYVTLTSSNASLVSLRHGDYVTIPPGHTTASFWVVGVGQGTATITASLNGTTAESQVTVGTAPPAVVSFLPPVLPLTEGSSGTLAVTLNAAQPTDTQVALHTSDATIVGLPGDSLTTPAGQPSASVSVTGLTRGTATVTASLNGTSATAAIEVQPPAPRVQGLTCPATLAVTATATCTVTLNATQQVDTVVPLASTGDGLVAVPESVTVPANALAAPFDVTAGLTPGGATITAGPVNGSSQTATVQVLPPPPTIVSLIPDSATLFVGATVTVTLTLNAAQLEDTAVPLSSTPTRILGVPETITVPAGNLSVDLAVTGLHLGSAALTAGPLHGTQAHCSLRVNRLLPTVTTLTPPTLSLPKGTADTLAVTIAPTQAETTVVNLVSDSSSVEVPPTVTVPAGDSTAALPVIARQEGSAMITAGPLNTTSKQATVTVTPAELVTLDIDPPAPIIAQGQTQPFKAMGTYTDATIRDLTGEAAWSSDIPAVATITLHGGLATAVGSGTTTITATHPDGSTGSTTLTVTLPPPTLTGFSPSGGPVGTAVTLTGTNLGSTSLVNFNGMAAVFTIQSSTQLTATVPAGATTGPIVVTTPSSSVASLAPFTVLVPPTITITSPANGATISITSAQVRGRVSGATSEVGISVNGFPAFVNSGQWVVEVPVTVGSNTLEARATDAFGGSSLVRITITVSPATPPALRLLATPESGVAPLTVTWQVLNQTGQNLVQFELDETGAGTFGPPMTSFDGVKTTYTAPRLASPTLRATDDQGNVYTATTLVNIEDPVAVTLRFQARWNGLKASLSIGDIPGALAQLSPNLQTRFQPLFQQLGPALPQVAAGLGDLTVLSQVDDLAEGAVLQSENGAPYLYFIYFRRDSLGRWLIEEM